MAKAKDPVARIERLFLALRDDPEAAAVVAKSKLRLAFELGGPPGRIAVDGRQRPFEVLRDAEGFAADLTLLMSCDTADRFFRGTLDLGRALAAGEIASRGSLFKMLELRALLARARETYRQIP